MNVEQLSNLIGKSLKLRPKAVGELGGVVIERPDDDWEVYSIQKKPPRSVTLMNIVTHQTIKLQGDNVHAFQSPNFLLLNCQVITIAPHGWKLEPRPHMWAPRVRRGRRP